LPLPIIENQGNGKFAIRPLPLRAQVSSIYGMVVYDVNGDGNLDLVYHGNFYNKNQRQSATMHLLAKCCSVMEKETLPTCRATRAVSSLIKMQKALGVIYVGKNQTPVLLGTNNNDKMFAYQLTSNSSKVPYTEQDRLCRYLPERRKEDSP
jgi:hypothetical protein